MLPTWLHSDRRSVISMIVFLFLFTWMLAGNLLESTITKNNLRHIKAPVREVNITQYKCSGRGRYSITTCERTKIAVEGERGYFKIIDYRYRYTSMYWLQPGDTIDLFVRHWYQYFFTLGRYKAIYILEKDNEVYYTFQDYRKGNLAYIILGALGIVVMGILLYLELNTPRWVAEGKLN